MLQKYREEGLPMTPLIVLTKKEYDFIAEILNWGPAGTPIKNYAIWVMTP